MTATTFFNPIVTLLSAAGAIIPDGYVQFYLTETTTPADVYSDADLQSSLGDVVDADSAGRLPTIYLDAEITYRVQIYDANDVLIRDIDPYYPPRDFAPGTVIWFYGTSGQRDAAYPPALWAVLDGNNGTPDGLGRYARIAGGGVSIGDTGGDTSVTSSSGGVHDHSGVSGSHTLTESEMPAHTHTVPYRSGVYGGGVNAVQNVGGSDGTATSGSTGGGGGHTHTISSQAGHTHTVDTLSPFIALWAVMRKYP